MGNKAKKGVYFYLVVLIGYHACNGGWDVSILCPFQSKRVRNHKRPCMHVHNMHAIELARVIMKCSLLIHSIPLSITKQRETYSAAYTPDLIISSFAALPTCIYLLI
jgi:hypothetical protein